MGRSGSSVAEHGADGAGALGGFPPGEGLGAVYGCRDPGSQCAGSSDRLYAVGQTGTEQDPDADESEASDLKGASSEPVVCISWIFRLQAFQSGK